MSTPRIAVSQSPFIRDADQNLTRTLNQLRQAASRGVDIMVFPEWFLGLNPVELIPNRLIDPIRNMARDFGIVVVAGSFRTLDAISSKKQQRCIVIDQDGSIAGTHIKLHFAPTERPWFEPGTDITAIHTRWGKVIVLPGLDAIHPNIYEQVKYLHPDLLVLATSAQDPGEKDALHKLTLSASFELQNTVVLAPLLGRFSGLSYVGGALIANRGKVLGQALDTDQETIILASDPDAPLIQPGVIDSSSSYTATLVVDKSPNDIASLEGEKRIFMDWAALSDNNLLQRGQALFNFVKENPRWLALAPARPHYAKDVHTLLEMGFPGAYIYPGRDRILPWEDSVREIGHVMSLYRRPLVVHSGPGAAPIRYDLPHLWDEFLFEFPSVPVVFFHMGGKRPFIDECLVLAERHPNVWLETSTTDPDTIIEAIHSIGDDRIIFGSGGSPSDFHREWNKLLTVQPHISPGSFLKLTHTNARQLFFSASEQAMEYIKTKNNLTTLRRPV